VFCKLFCAKHTNNFLQKFEAFPIPAQYTGMKYKLLLSLVVIVIFIVGCGEGLNQASYQPLLPPIPPHWQLILGEPHWRLEWLNENGAWETWDGSPGSKPPFMYLISEWTTPVLAWPFWPGRNLLPGIMRPAGALFPWDASGGNLKLSWRGGVDAFFWKELAAAERVTEAGERRLPWYFDWPRFRELFEGDVISEVIRNDPWLADWRDISHRTVQSGFDRRRIAARKFTEVVIPGLGGYWIGSSPFAEPLYLTPDDPLILNVSDAADTWVSSRVVLRCSTAGWVVIRN
jgi:hypothetical protein